MKMYKTFDMYLLKLFKVSKFYCSKLNNILGENFKIKPKYICF